MTRFPLVVLCAAVAFGVSGRKIVKDAPEDDQAIAADASGDDARTAQRIADTFEPQLITHIRETAMTLDALGATLAGGIDAAGTAHGVRGAGAGALWNFAVTGAGKVVDAKLGTPSRTVERDVDGDSAADLTLQLGPVLKGSALRDPAPFYNFDGFRDQIEFAKLARSLHDAVRERIVPPRATSPAPTSASPGWCR